MIRTIILFPLCKVPLHTFIHCVEVAKKVKIKLLQSKLVVNIWKSLPWRSKKLKIRRFSKQITNFLQETLLVSLLVIRKKKVVYSDSIDDIQTFSICP